MGSARNLISRQGRNAPKRNGIMYKSHYSDSFSSDGRIPLELFLFYTDNGYMIVARTRMLLPKDTIVPWLMVRDIAWTIIRMKNPNFIPGDNVM